MTQRRLAVPLALLTLLLFACGGDDKPDPRALLSQTLKKVGEQRVISATLKTTIVSGDVDLEVQQEVIVEPPLQKGYAKTQSGLLDENEIAIEGRKAWVRSPGRAWQETTAARLGIRPESLTATADTSQVAKTVELMPDVTHDGRRSHHVRVVIDPKTKGLADLAPSLASLADLDADEVVMDYFIAKNDGLLYFVRIGFEATEDGEKFKLTVEATYHDYNKPPAYPKDMPR
jgi:hypothetical protein